MIFQVPNTDTTLVDKVNEIYLNLIETHKYLNNMSLHIKEQQGPFDPLAIKLDAVVKALGPFGQAEAIEIAYYSQEMQG